jgi:hypothetical protein
MQRLFDKNRLVQGHVTEEQILEVNPVVTGFGVPELHVRKLKTSDDFLTSSAGGAYRGFGD